MGCKHTTLVRLTPAQLGMTALLGGFAGRRTRGDLAAEIRQGRDLLVSITGVDFGYDPCAWHEHLVATDAGGYRWSNKHLGFPTQIKRAAKNMDWERAIRQITDSPIS